MSDPISTSQAPYNLLPTDIEGVDYLAELALDLHLAIRGSGSVNGVIPLEDRRVLWQR
jgi:hypothetical protein